jgi:bis(5'-nucleosyl)-tetraphosphatase (symmetrical)
MREQVGRNKLLMFHAGVLPAWTATQTIALAHEVEAVLRSPDCPQFLGDMYGNTPTAWEESLTGMARLRVIVNALTRLRFCTPEGVMEFDSKDGAASAPPGFLPWFDIPQRQTAAHTVAFGHWSTLGWLARTDVLAMDTGCVWGGCLTAARLSIHDAGGALQIERIQVKCPQAQAPGSTRP